MTRRKTKDYAREAKDAICYWHEWPEGCLDDLPYEAWLMIRDSHSDYLLREIENAWEQRGEQ